MIFLITTLASLILTTSLMPMWSRLARKLHALDEPNARKIHDRVVPKCGGMAMAVGVILPLLLWVPISQFSKSVLIGTSIIVVLGIIDDV